MNRTIKKINPRKVFIVIGYSFRDNDSLAKFRSSLSLNEELKLIILNDKAEGLKQNRFKNFGKNVISFPYR